MSPTALLTPAYKLTFRESSGGAAGAVSSAAGSALGSGGRVIDTTDDPQTSTVVDLVVKLDMDSLADRFSLVMGQVGSFRPARGQQIDIELGYDDDAGVAQVMTGTITTVEPNLVTRRISGHSPAETLLHTFVDESHLDRSAGQMVKDLADRAGVDVENASDGIRFPAYVTDGRRSIYHHMRHLADLCGFDLYINAAGKLVFEKYTGGKTVHVFDYGKHILELALEQTPPAAGSVEAWGESPGSSGDAWAWLTKDFSGLTGKAGSGDPKTLLEKPALRTATAARQAAEAANTRIRRNATRGSLLVLGLPAVKLGDGLRIREVPETVFNAAYQVRGVTHRITKSGGFTTRVEFRGID